MPYLRVLREVPQVSFISDVARVAYIDRIVRLHDRAGPVIPLGGDGLGTSKNKFDSGKRTFTFIGEIEPRQNVAAILLAFEKLWDAEVDASLMIVGKVDPQAPEEAAILERLKGRAQFTHVTEATEEALREILSGSRATISVGSADGFGVRPYESLCAAVPVIALKGIPSLDLISPGGRLTIERASPELIADAVITLLNDRVAEKLRDEASLLEVPTWNGFVRQLAAWVQHEGVEK
ncbi:hypothetical protein CU102_23045 [Phyllobacterium brassicacearum]|uniref:Glycosyl transferase family 1 domain-containing protein n=2 Tax=Phyllobacterium brassicacearum TaxID=314235 RepID=A0A2P7BBE8_9HYPH|nr:hypothetical protein CU102_23045 [Phyllobacterium brassicacearum]